MLKVRVIPTLLWKGPGLVKGVGFDSWRRIGTVMPAIKVYNARDVDELVLLDIAATGERRVPDFDAISELAAECFVPLTVGGGVRSVDTIRELLRAGADKVAVNTAAYEQPGFIAEAARLFGSQCVVASVDARRAADGRYQCFSNCGASGTGREVAEHARWLEANGAGEILLTSVERDGAMQGYDLELIRTVTASVRIPVIASGGAGQYADFVAAVNEADASAVAASSMFQFTERTPAEAKAFMASHGIAVRKNVAAPARTR
jgi:cyclase